MRRRKGSKSVSKPKVNLWLHGTEYKSKLEMFMANELREAGIDFEYEKFQFELIPSFYFGLDSYERQGNEKKEMVNRGNKKSQGIKYTPDFVGDGFVIETKGRANESFPIRWKLFKKYIVDNNIKTTLYKPQNMKECTEVIRLILNKR